MGLDRSWRKQILKSIATNSSPILELSSLISRQTMAKTQPNLFAAYEKKKTFFPYARKLQSWKIPQLSNL